MPSVHCGSADMTLIRITTDYREIREDDLLPRISHLKEIEAEEKMMGPLQVVFIAEGVPA